MPKETVNYPSYADNHPMALAVGIHWSDATAGYAGPQVSIQFNVDDMHAYLTRLRQDSPGDKRTIVFTEPLTRPEMQRMIRAAKRARDASFGADE